MIISLRKCCLGRSERSFVSQCMQTAFEVIVNSHAASREITFFSDDASSSIILILEPNNNGFGLCEFMNLRTKFSHTGIQQNQVIITFFHLDL